MADKSVTYNGAYIIQSGMPVSNYVGSEQDNVKFQPDSAQEGSIKGTFTNTHQPMESNDVEWKKVEVNWTRSTTGTNYNLLSQNQSNCGSEGTIEGFSKVKGTETLTVDITNYYVGSSSIKVTTPGNAVNEGVIVGPIGKFNIGQKISAKVAIKGSGIVYFTINEYTEDGVWITGKSYGNITLSSTWQVIDWSITMSKGTKAVLAVATANSAQAVSFNVDYCQINLGNPVPWVTGPYSDFNADINIYGIMHDGEPELIGTSNVNTISPTSITENAIFDLAGGAGEPPISRTQELMSAGKIKLDLPMKLGNYESIVLKHSPYDPDWSHVKTIPITGSADFSYSGYVTVQYYVTYDADMNSNFSDIRFAIWNSANQQFVDISYFFHSMLDASTAIFFLRIPSLPKSPAITNIYMFYGNPNATTTSDSSVLYYYDNFEDGRYTGRSSPYRNYSVNNGTPAIISSGQIAGTYSLKHTGNNGGNSAGMLFTETSDSGIIDFDFKLAAQGSGAQDPYVDLFYIQYVDYNNWLAVDTYWNGTNQQIRLVKRLSGTTTIVTTWTTSSWNRKMLANEQHHYKIIYYLPTTGTQYVTVIVDSTKVINSFNPSFVVNASLKGLGCGQTAAGIWDNIIIRPYIGSFVFQNGKDATYGTITPEDTQVLPDTWDNEQQYAIFTLPSDYVANCPICFDIDEMDSSPYETPDIVATSTNVFKLGYDHTAKYHALRVVVETNAGTMENILFNYIKYNYELTG